MMCLHEESEIKIKREMRWARLIVFFVTHTHTRQDIHVNDWVRAFYLIDPWSLAICITRFYWREHVKCIQCSVDLLVPSTSYFVNFTQCAAERWPLLGHRGINLRRLFFPLSFPLSFSWTLYLVNQLFVIVSFLTSLFSRLSIAPS